MKTLKPITLILSLLLTAGLTLAGEGKGWLGVSLGMTSERPGVRVMGVVVDSPAEAAGVQRGDMVLQMDGMDIKRARDISAAIDHKAPGENVTLTLLRDGRETTAVVRLGATPNTFVFAGADGEDGTWTQDIIRRGSIVKMTPDGEMLIEDIDSAGDPHLAHATAAIFGGPASIEVDTRIENGNRLVTTRFEDGDQKFKIVQGNDLILVTRDGVEREYADLDELRAADPDVAAVLDRHGHMTRAFGGSGHNVFELHTGDGAFGTNVEIVDADGEHGEHKAIFVHDGGTRRAFRVRPDGTVEVKIHDGGNTLVREFTSVDDLRSRDYDLYLHYEKMLEKMKK